MHEQIIRRSDAPSSPLFSQAIKVGTGGRRTITMAWLEGVGHHEQAPA
jgi:hypothetical protein